MNLYINMFEALLYTYDLCQGENKNKLILDIEDQNITCAFASKTTKVAYLNLKSSITSECFTYSNNALQ